MLLQSFVTFMPSTGLNTPTQDTFQDLPKFFYWLSAVHFKPVPLVWSATRTHPKQCDIKIATVPAPLATGLPVEAHCNGSTAVPC